MIETEMNLTEQERDALREIAERTAKSQGALVREAVERLIGESQREDSRSLMRRGRGIWQTRQDVPGADDLRREWDRGATEP